MVEAVERQMNRGAYRGARQNLEQDLRRHVQQWLRDDYEAAANEYAKAELLALIDDLIARLETILANDGNGGGNGNGNG